MKLRFFFFFLFGVNCGFCQNISLSRVQALADIDTLVNWIVYTHPNPFTVCPESVFRERIASVKAELPDTLTDLEFAKKVSPCVAILGDGHTFMSFPKPDLQNSFFFPLAVRAGWRDSSLTLVDDSARVTHINGMPVQEILGNMLQYRGGEKMYFRFMYLQQMFSFFLTALYPDSVYRLTLCDANGKQEEKTVNALPLEEIKKQTEAKRIERGKSNEREDYAFSLSRDGKSMYFEFNYFNDLDKFKVFTDSMFREIKERKIKNLVIDIRRNGGGNSGLGDELLQYLLHTPFSQFGKIDARIGRYTMNRVQNKEGLKEVADTLISVSFPLKPLRQEPLRVAKKTKVYLLVSNFTYSSAASFSWAFQYFKGGMIVGEESGGMNVTFGDVCSYTLPYSRLQCGVSWKKFYHYGADDQDIHGTLPDVEVPAEQSFEYTVKHLIGKRR